MTEASDQEREAFMQALESEDVEGPIHRVSVPGSAKRVLFHARSVQGLGLGLKSVTRRPQKPQPPGHLGRVEPVPEARNGKRVYRFFNVEPPRSAVWPTKETPDQKGWLRSIRGGSVVSPYGHEGDLLYVAEPIAILEKRLVDRHYCCLVEYEADRHRQWVQVPLSFTGSLEPTDRASEDGFRAALLCPKWATRTLLRLEEEPRLEPLQEITALGIMQEGYRPIEEVDAEGNPDSWDEQALFDVWRRVWDGMYAGSEVAYDEDPWVWVYPFKVVHFHGSIAGLEEGLVRSRKALGVDA